MTNRSEKDKYLIILSTSYWHSPLKFRRHQWALIAARKGFHVIYVNPTFTITSFVQDVDARKVFWDFFKKRKQENDNLSILTMPPLIPFQRKFLWVDKINRMITGWLLKRKLRNVTAAETTVLVYEPNDIYRINSLPASVLVYECVDEHSEYPFNYRVKNQVIAMEKKLLIRADILSVSSLFLLEKKKAFNQNHVYVPNGVNYELFHRALHPATPIAEDIRAIPGPVILYVGAIMEWFDYELLLKVAENKNWSVVLIGPQTVNINLLKGQHNIFSLGIKKQSDLPNYLKKADVCIIPFLINDLVKGVNPLKLYEYLAAGKPVVSTALPDVIPFAKRDFVHIGYNHAEFVEHVDYLIKLKDNEQLMEARSAVASEYSWENIYKKLFDAVEALHEKKAG